VKQILERLRIGDEVFDTCFTVFYRAQPILNWLRPCLQLDVLPSEHGYVKDDLAVDTDMRDASVAVFYLYLFCPKRMKRDLCVLIFLVFKSHILSRPGQFLFRSFSSGATHCRNPNNPG